MDGLEVFRAPRNCSKGGWVEIEEVFEKEGDRRARGSRNWEIKRRSQIRQNRVNVLQRRLGKNKIGYRHRLKKEK